MKILFFSDAHGCANSLRTLTLRVADEAPDLVAFLGDALYHGPRNAIQDDYAPQEATDLFNALIPKIVAVRGNCDAEVDQMLLRFPIQETSATLWADDVRVFLTHGHVWGPENPPPFFDGDLLATGHTHVPMIRPLPGGLTALNPGSIALPKGGSVASYATLTARTLALKALATGAAYRTVSLPERRAP